MRFLSYLAAAALLSTAPAYRLAESGADFEITESPAAAQRTGLSQQGFEAWLPWLRAQTLQAGVSPSTVARVFPSLEFSARAVALDRAQPGGASGASAIPPFAPYRARHVTSGLINRGRDRYAENIGQLNEIGRRYGVHPSILVAIWGKETSYGAITGDFDLLNALASLAYEGRRRELFTEEFIATMKMLERGFARERLKGSWAGATGQSQFLPSNYIRLGVDGDGDGRSDIWGSELDALASIANYLRDAGWRPGLSWGTAATVPAGFDRSRIASPLQSPRCARVHERHSRWLTLDEWRRLGVVPRDTTAIPGDALLTLIEPDGPGATAYLATTNYRSVLDYNCSNFYALTVVLLADAVRG